MNEVAEIAQRLKGVPDPVAFLASVFAFAPVGLQIYRADGHSLLTNRAFRDIFGSEPPPEYNVLHDEIAERNGVLGLIRRAFAGETITTPPVWYDPRELEQVQIAQARRVWMEATFVPLRNQAGEVTHVAIVFKDLTTGKLAADRAAALLDVSAALSEAVGTREMSAAILDGAVAAVGAPKGSFAVLDANGAELHVVDSIGYSRRIVEHFARMKISDGNPIAESVRTGKPVWVRSRSELQQRYPATLAAGPLDEGVRAALPLVIEGRPLGCIALTFDQARDSDPAEWDFLQALARLCAQAYERARLSDARARDVERSAERARFVAAASAAFSESLDLQTTLRRVADVCVPRLADYCVVDLERRDGTFERIAYACGDPAKAAVLDEVTARYPAVEGSGQPGMLAVRARAPVQISELNDAVLKTLALDEGHAGLMRKLGATSVLAVPLLARGQPLGALTLGFFTPRRMHSAEEIVLAQDLAHRAALAVDAARLYAEAQRAVRLREDFLSIAGHELKTPLTALFLQIQTVKRRVDKADSLDPSRVRPSLDVAERQIRRLTGLVHQLLDVSRLAAGRLSLELDRFDLADLAREVAARFGDDDARGGSEIRIVADGPLAGRWDRLRLDQVLTNLLTNAIRYGQGSAIDVEVRASDGGALLRVRDRGIGIAPQDQARIFERFERAAPLRNYGGVGLGLWIVHELVLAMGGTVSVESEPGKGATFTVALPLESRAPDATPPRT